MIKYRDHRGSLAESMETVQEFETGEDLVDYLKKDSSFPVFIHLVEIKHYCFDKRINWETHIVTVKGFGVMGFTDGKFSKGRL